MPKKLFYNGAYVRVNVDRPFGREVTPRHWHDAAADLLNDIKRHCDGIESLSVEFDTEELCEFCGSAWTEVSNTHNECCEKDALAHEERNTP